MFSAIRKVWLSSAVRGFRLSRPSSAVRGFGFLVPLGGFGFLVPLEGFGLLVPLEWFGILTPVVNSVPLDGSRRYPFNSPLVFFVTRNGPVLGTGQDEQPPAWCLVPEVLN